MSGTAMRRILALIYIGVHVLLSVKADGCPIGFYGPGCRRRCKEQSHCLDNDCILLRSGRALNCSRGCKPGWRGLSCNTNCKHPCKKCERYTGECVGACRDGYYGDTCYRYCSQGCARCEQVSGSCLECAPSFYGSNCSRDCPTDCVKCDFISGECVSGMNDHTSSRAKLAGPRADAMVGLSDGVGLSDSTHSDAVTSIQTHTVFNNKTDTDNDSGFSSSRPGGSSSMDRESLVITVIIGVLVFICVVVVTTTYFLLFYSRKERITRLKEWEWGSESPFLNKEYVIPGTERAYPTAESAEQENSSAEPVYHEIDSPKDSVNTSHYITPVHNLNTELRNHNFVND